MDATAALVGDRFYVAVNGEEQVMCPFAIDGQEGFAGVLDCLGSEFGVSV
jgi:hypothetical protein